MDETWGLSGPEFLQLYGAALVVLLLLSVAVALLAKRDGHRSDAAAGSGAELGTYELAYLFGGVDRVAETAVAGLVEAGSVRVTRSRELHSLGGQWVGGQWVGGQWVARGSYEYQNKVLECSWQDINRLRRAFRVSDLGEPLRRSLQQRGLVITEPRRRASELVAWLFPLLGLVGVARLLSGVANGNPVGFLVLELFGTGLVWAGARTAGQNPRPTRLGERVKQERGQQERTRGSLHGKHAPVRSAEPVTAALLVAVSGVSAYPDSELAGLLVPPTSSGGGRGGSDGCGGSGCPTSRRRGDPPAPGES